MKRRVLIAAGLYPPDVGGPATYAALIETALPEHDIHVTVVPFRLVRHTSKLFRHLRYLMLLWHVSKEVDCIYALDPVSVGIPAAIVARLRGLPLLLRLGGDYAWEQGRQRFSVTTTLDEYSRERSNARFMVRVLHWLQRLVATQAARVIVPSQYLKHIVVSWPVPEDKVNVIHSVVTPLPVGESKDNVRAKIGVTGTVVSTAARLTPWKGVATLLRVVAALPPTHPVTLLIAGDGPERERLETLSRELNVQTNVQFFGALNKKELADVLRASDVFVLNTAYEGLSHQLLEVMGVGVPIVTTDVGGNPELVTHNETGLLVPFDDEEALLEAVTLLITDSALAESLTTAASVRARTFTPERMMAKLSATIEEVICSS